MNLLSSVPALLALVSVTATVGPIGLLSAQAPPCPDEGMGTQVDSKFDIGPDLLCGGSVINITPPLSISGGQTLKKCPAFINFEPAYMFKKTKVGFRITGTRAMTGYLVLYNCETSYFFFMFPWDKKCNVASQTPFGSFISHISEAVCPVTPIDNKST